MSTTVMLAVLVGAFLHASWNALVKSSSDKFLDTVVLFSCAAVMSLPALFFLPLPAPAAWPYLLGSAAIHLAYFLLVAAAYRAADMSFAYPLMRGTAPLLVALASGALLGEHLSTAAWAGVLLICGGVLGLTLAYRPAAGTILPPLAFGLGNAGVIAAYTLTDGLGARLSGNALSYTLWNFLLAALPLLTVALIFRRRDLLPHLRRRWRQGIGGGACSIGSYALALWAMTQAPIASVAALREVSILFAIALASFALKERVGYARTAAAVAVLGGAVALRLG
ncbi:DMT family transporter [Oceanibaculum pacificum]|uniref:EamA domain-containing protein n=1 Tax=Oceanibaculum pacificum TaxID=580166 RepID=A0A154WFI0_9PROT|nr:DMT family transporter [Oceanibaculum pacificum]KZD12262.1 hypothetical protein AUP43_16960 [Oceanibaculum pacificum]